jgi:hypothetical protein
MLKTKIWGLWFQEYAKRWNKSHLWDSYILVADAWLAGYHKCKEEMIKVMTINDPNFGDICPPEVVRLGDNEVEVSQQEIDEQKLQFGLLDKIGQYTMQERLERDFGKMYGCQYIKTVEDGDDILVFAKFKNRYK